MVDTLSYRKYSDWSDIYSVYIGKAGLFQRQGDSDNQADTILWSSLASQSYCTAENYWGRISRFCGYLRKFSPWNLGNGVLWRGTSEQSTNVFSYSSPIRDFFSLKSFPLYSSFLYFWHSTTQPILNFFNPVFQTLPEYPHLTVQSANIHAHTWAGMYVSHYWWNIVSSIYWSV